MPDQFLCGGLLVALGRAAYPAGGAYLNRQPLRLNDKPGYDFGLAVYTTAGLK